LEDFIPTSSNSPRLFSVPQHNFTTPAGDHLLVEYFAVSDNEAFAVSMLTFEVALIKGQVSRGM
jgi:hypothetical protein